MREVDQALARAFARQGARDRRHSTAVPPPPHIAPALPIKPPLVESERPSMVFTIEPAFAGPFDRLIDAFADAQVRHNFRALLFANCHQAQGRTALLLNLARVLARGPGRTVLVDADLSGPMLARALGLRPTVGLDDVVERGHALADALIDVADENLTVLPLRRPISNPRDFLASPLWSNAMSLLRREFDFVLIDANPLFAGLSTMVMNRCADAAILVHERTQIGQRALRRAREVLEAGKIPLLGLAETFVAESAMKDR